MTTSTYPIRDTGRLAALRRTALLETGGDPVFDRAARLAARVHRAPVTEEPPSRLDERARFGRPGP